MSTIFDGKQFAQNNQVRLSIAANSLISRGITPKLATLLIGDNETSKLYVRLKKLAAQKIGCEVDVYEIPSSKTTYYIVRLIKYLNQDPDIHGIMVQLPLPPKHKKHQDRIIETIATQKDVDAMKAKTPFDSPTAQAVMAIMHEAERRLNKRKKGSLAVVGANGNVGKWIVKLAEKESYEVTQIDRYRKDPEVKPIYDILISATGVPDLIKSKMVKKGSIIIDVGEPKPDVDSKVAQKVAFLSPVPGGVGPVTIQCLLENLILAAANNQSKI